MAKLYPIHSGCQLAGHSGMFMSWLCTAITLVGTSHTTHLVETGCTRFPLQELSTNLDMNSGIARSATGIMGMGSLVESQYDLSFRLA